MEKEKLSRCFIALELSRESINEIENLQTLIKNKNVFAGRFTEPENLHLTLKFLGEIAGPALEEVKKKLREIKLAEFEVSLGEIGVFFNKSSKLLWIKLNGKPIWNLQKLIDGKLAGSFKPEERFMSHITIARIKKVYSKDAFLNYVKNIKPKKIKFKVKEFALKKSELKPEGPIYTTLENYPL